MIALTIQIPLPVYLRVRSRNYLSVALREAVALYLRDYAAKKTVPDPIKDPRMGHTRDHALKSVAFNVPGKHADALRLIADHLKVKLACVLRAALLHYTRHTRTPAEPIIKVTRPHQVTCTVSPALHNRVLRDYREGCRSNSEVYRSVLMAFLERLERDPDLLPSRSELRQFAEGPGGSGVAFRLSDDEMRKTRALAAYHRASVRLLATSAFYMA